MGNFFTATWNNIKRWASMFLSALKRTAGFIIDRAIEEVKEDGWRLIASLVSIYNEKDIPGRDKYDAVFDEAKAWFISNGREVATSTINYIIEHEVKRLKKQ